MASRNKTICWILAVGGVAVAIGCGTSQPERQEDRRQLQQPSTYRIYVTNEASGDLSVIDSGTHEVIETVPLGKRPRGIRASPDRLTIYVALSGSPFSPPWVDKSTLPPPDRSADGIGVFDIGQNKLLGVLESGSDPETFDLSKDGSLLYVSNEDAATVSIVDVASAKVVQTLPVGEEPEGVKTAPDGKFVYVTSESEGTISVIDTTAVKVIETFRVCFRPRSVAFTPDGSRAYVPCEMGSSVAVVDSVKHTLLQTIPFGGKVEEFLPMGVVLSPDAARAYVSTGRGRKVFVIDTAIDKVLSSIEVGERPWGIALSPDGKILYTANGPGNDVSVVDLATQTVIKKIKVGDRPWGVITLAPANRGLAQAPAWQVDTLHSGAHFSVRHLMVSTVRGQFGGLKGQVRIDNQDITKSTVDVTIDTTTITTGNPDRDAELKGAEFFDVEKFPLMVFRSKRVERLGPGRLRLIGDLTLRGVTREVTLDTEEPTPPISDNKGALRRGATATARLNRSDFGITWNPVLEAGGVTVSEEVSLTLDVELVKSSENPLPAPHPAKETSMR